MIYSAQCFPIFADGHKGRAIGAAQIKGLVRAEHMGGHGTSVLSVFPYNRSIPTIQDNHRPVLYKVVPVPLDPYFTNPV